MRVKCLVDDGSASGGRALLVGLPEHLVLRGKIADVRKFLENRFGLATPLLALTDFPTASDAPLAAVPAASPGSAVPGVAAAFAAGVPAPACEQQQQTQQQQQQKCKKQQQQQQQQQPPTAATKAQGFVLSVGGFLLPDGDAAVELIRDNDELWLHPHPNMMTRTPATSQQKRPPPALLSSPWQSKKRRGDHPEVAPEQAQEKDDLVVLLQAEAQASKEAAANAQTEANDAKTATEKVKTALKEAKTALKEAKNAAKLANAKAQQAAEEARPPTDVDVESAVAKALAEAKSEANLELEKAVAKAVAEAVAAERRRMGEQREREREQENEESQEPRQEQQQTERRGHAGNLGKLVYKPLPSLEALEEGQLLRYRVAIPDPWGGGLRLSSWRYATLSRLESTSGHQEAILKLKTGAWDRVKVRSLLDVAVGRSA